MYEKLHKQIDEILDKKIDVITKEDVDILDSYLPEAAWHDCEDPVKHCSICWRACRINKVLEKIMYQDKVIELEIEQALETG